MKISNLETAMKLAKITGRPLEEFYNGVRETIEDKQEEEILLEEQEVQCSDGLEEDVSEIKDHDEEGVETNDDADNNRHVNKEDDTRPREDDVYTIKYGGRLSENGKLIGHTKDMTNAEYKTLTKKMTQGEILKSPLLYVFFRAEDQKEANFYNWLEKFTKE